MKNELIKNIKSTWKYTKGSRWQLFGCLLLMFLSSLLGVITPILSAKQMLYINTATWEKLLMITVIYFAFETLLNVIYYIHVKLYRAFEKKTIINVQTALAEEILNLEVKELDKNTSGLFVDRISKDAQGLASSIDMIFSNILRITTNVGILIAIFVINKLLFLFFALVIFALFTLDKARIKSYYTRYKTLRSINEKNTGVINEMIRGLRDIKVLNAYGNVLDHFKETMNNSLEKRNAMINGSTRWITYRDTSTSFADVLYVFLAVALVLNNSLTLENLLIVFMYRNRVYGLLSVVTSLIENSKEFNLSASRVYEIFDDTKFKKEKFGDINVDKLSGHIEFRNVTFKYDKRGKVLDKLSFEVNQNQKVAFVGKSGAGKSTIFSLLSKMYTCKNGNIYLDGYNINDLTKDSIRNNMSIITQTPYIFNMSIKDNLKLVKKDATLKEIKKVCNMACIDKFIETLPNKYNTILGEGGITLSGGQRQRLAIARALLMKTEIILFDEATSALDNETQREINKAIDNLKGEYTILIVAHRLSTVINCDKIFVVDEGKIIDFGTHKELMERCDFYKNLYESEA